MKLASYLVSFILFAPVLVVSQKTETNAAKPGLHDIILKTVQDTASYLGFGVKCRNNGHKTEENSCICPKYFKGKECETRICINGGKLEKVTVPTVHHVCKCPHPEFIEGEHCERIRCDHNGELRSYQNGTWSCDCSNTRIYGGKFCEKFIVSSGWIMIGICFFVFVIVACICSSNWFSRKRNHRGYNPNRLPTQTTSHSRAQARDSSGRRIPSSSNHRSAQRSSSADDLISSERGAHRRTAAYPTGGITQQYVVRLDTIPTFNPSMIGGVEPPNPNDQLNVGPPPSYDQAMSSVRAEPPVYTPTDTSKTNA